MADFSLENAAGAGHGVLVAGVDEVGRGALAGPVVAAAVVFHRRRLAGWRPLIRDSKTLTPRQRETIALELPRFAWYATGIAEIAEIETLNVLGASLLAMHRAIDALPEVPQISLIDGAQAPLLEHTVCRCVPHGDARSLSIAAASIIAKVTRDRIMRELDARYPGYGWTRNSGYATPFHLEALRRLGPTPVHRRGFHGVGVEVTGGDIDLHE